MLVVDLDSFLVSAYTVAPPTTTARIIIKGRYRLVLGKVGISLILALRTTVGYVTFLL